MRTLLALALALALALLAGCTNTSADAAAPTPIAISAELPASPTPLESPRVAKSSTIARYLPNPNVDGGCGEVLFTGRGGAPRYADANGGCHPCTLGCMHLYGEQVLWGAEREAATRDAGLSLEAEYEITAGAIGCMQACEGAGAVVWPPR